MDYKIVTDLDELKKPCQPCQDWNEGYEVANYLIECMKTMPYAVGLAANQVGINKRVCVVWMDRRIMPWIFVNPSIIPGELSTKFAFVEGCLSFPGDKVTTLRESRVVVKHLNDFGIIWDTFHLSPSSQLFLAALQHEIDHLDGITMYDRSYTL